MYVHNNILQQNKWFAVGVIAVALVIGILGVNICYQVLHNLSDSRTRSGSTSQTPPMSSKPAPKDETPLIHFGLLQSTDPQLRLLAQYERRLGRGFNSKMFFRDMPATVTAAQQKAAEIAPVLAEYAKQGIKPLVIFEPEGLDLRRLDKRVYEQYFKTLKSRGITDKAMGTWVPLPEPNIPEWGNPVNDKGLTDPALFVKNFTMVAQALKGSFPTAKAAVLLDSATYPNFDVNYRWGSYEKIRLLKYVEGFKPGLVDEFGLQGFPWGEKGGRLKYDPGRFIDADLAIAAAKRLAVKRVWLNTGTFSRMYEWDPALRVSVSNSQRARILEGIAVQARQVQQAGFAATVNIFAENKSATEANWSYADAASWNMFQNFVDRMESTGIDFTVFDAPK